MCISALTGGHNRADSRLRRAHDDVASGREEGVGVNDFQWQPSTTEVRHGNDLDCSVSVVFARWWRVGIFSLARITSGSAWLTA